MRSHSAGIVLAVAFLPALVGCDPNSKPVYAEDSGLPVNCRAIVQVNIDAYRARQYTADEVMASLERNCGANGYAWGQR